jgi:integrase/recombinase XerD
MHRAVHSTAALVPDIVQTPNWDRNRRAKAGFLSGYEGTTRAGHARELEMFDTWCRTWGLDILDDVSREHIQMYAMELKEIRGRKKSTVAHKLSVLSVFYEYCAEEDLVPRNPALRVKRPKLEYITTREHLDDAELRRFLAAASDAEPRATALCRLLAINALRVSEALNADVEDLGHEGHHRTLRIVRKGGKIRRPPLSPFVSMAIDHYLSGEGRTAGPIFLGREGERMNRHAASRIVKRLCRQIGVTKAISPHSLRHSAITSLLNAGIPLRDVQLFADHSDPRTTSYYDHGRRSYDSHPTYALASFVGGG